MSRKRKTVFYKIKKQIYKILIYLTNNEYYPKDEILFDNIFLIVNTIALVIGIPLFLLRGEGQWIAVLIIEYTWALDNMRHNRS